MTTSEIFQEYIEKEIPLAQSLNLKVIQVAPKVVIELPLDGNNNNKATAFAGSISSALSLGGWIASQFLADNTLSSKTIDVFIAESNIKYTKPVLKDFIIEIDPFAEKSVELFKKMLTQKSRAKIKLTGRVLSDGQQCADFKATYAALVQDYT